MDAQNRDCGRAVPWLGQALGPGPGVEKLEDRSLERAGDREAGYWQDQPC